MTHSHSVRSFEADSFEEDEENLKHKQRAHFESKEIPWQARTEQREYFKGKRDIDEKYVRHQ